jgi:hypothetical protein
MDLENALSSAHGLAEVALSSLMPPLRCSTDRLADAFGIPVLDDCLRQQLKALMIQMCLA